MVVLVEPVVGLVDDPNGFPVVGYLTPRTVNNVGDFISPDELEILSESELT